MTELLHGDQAGISDALDRARLLASFLQNSASVLLFDCGSEGVVRSTNQAGSALTEPHGNTVGEPVFHFVASHDVATLRARLAAPREPERRFRLAIGPPGGLPRSYECQLDLHPDGFVLIGEPLFAGEAASNLELVRLNNDLALLTRELARKSREIEHARAEAESALGDLRSSHWHLRKIQEVLPICMSCGRVKTGESHWQGVVDYLKANALFLSHGYCPPCADEFRAQMRRDRR